MYEVFVDNQLMEVGNVGTINRPPRLFHTPSSEGLLDVHACYFYNVDILT
jgi:hypothetical protein